MSIGSDHKLREGEHVSRFAPYVAALQQHMKQDHVQVGMRERCRPVTRG
jgi:hypothetical protein